jgi:enoyl-CoA hydratase/carnithine racemase
MLSIFLTTSGLASKRSDREMADLAEQLITKDLSSGICILTINCPEQTNKLTVPVMQELTAALMEADADPECKVVILTGVGEYFCNGGNLGDYRAQSPFEIRRFGDAFITLHMTVVKLTKPVIAAVQGDAHGGGLNLVEACDLAVASADAGFSVPEMRFGIAPMMALTGLGRVLGRKGVMELALFAETISAQRAFEIGFLNWICAKEDVLQEARAIAGRLVNMSPVAVASCKRLYYEADALNYQKQLESGLNMLVTLLKSDDAAEAMSARTENRAPVWSGK